MSLNKYIKIGSKIKEIRKKKGISQKEMAEEILNIPRSTYSNYENNNRVPNEEILQKIAEVLKINIDQLIGVNQKPKKEYNFDFNKIIDLTYDIFEEIYYHDKIWADRNDPLSPKEFHQKDKYFIAEITDQVKNLIADKIVYQDKKIREGMLNEKKSQVDDSNIKNISYAKNIFDEDSRGGIVESANQFELGNKLNDKQYLKDTIKDHEKYLMNAENVEGWRKFLKNKIEEYKIKLGNVEAAGGSKDNYKLIEEKIKSAHKDYLEKQNPDDNQLKKATQKDIDKFLLGN